MAAVTGNPPPSVWSSCSRQDLDDAFNSFGLDHCLKNEPAVILGTPVCGNGLREDGEVCDCGTPDVRETLEYAYMKCCKLVGQQEVLYFT